MHPALLPAALSQLSPTIRRIANQALDGSIEDFMAMTRIFRDPSFQKAELLAPALMANLAGDRMPTEHDLGHDNPQWPLAFNTVFRAQTSLLLLRVPQVIKKLPEACFVDIWKRAWPWIHLTSTFHELLGSLDGEDMFSCHIELIQQLRRDPSTAKLMDTTAGIRSVLARAIKCLYPDDNEVNKYWEFIDGWELLGDLKIEKAAHVDEILEGFSTSLDGLASTVVRHLDLVIEDFKNDGVQPAAFYIGSAYTQINVIGPSFTTYLHSYGIVTSLTNMLRIFVEVSDDIAYPEIWDFFSILHGDFLLGGVARVSEAISAGFLQMMILSATSTHCEKYTRARVDVEQMLTSFLPQFTVYHSVLGSIDDVLLEADILAYTPQFKASSIAQPWKSFRVLVEQRMLVRNVHVPLDSKSFQGCHGPNCDEIMQRADSRRCSHCRSVYYCSKVCQKEDWREGHRASCHSIRLCIPEDPFNRRDRLFMGALAQYDYRQNRDAIVAKLYAADDASEWESAGAAHCVVFDYTRGVLDVSIRTWVPTDRQGQKKADALLREQTWRRGWANYGPESGLLVMRVSCGDRLREHLVWAH